MPTVYLMARLVDYHDPCYDAALTWIHAQLPQAITQSPRELFRSNRDWRERWTSLVQDIHVGIVVTERYIGPGVAQELHDLADRDVPLLWLRAEPGRLRLVARFRAYRWSHEAWYFGYLTEDDQLPRFHPDVAR